MLEIVERGEFDKLLAVVAEDMATIRVGGASAKMVNEIVAEVYGGQRMKLVELANISAPDSSQIIITPWDQTVVRAIEKAILESDLGLMPNVNGNLIRIIVPPMSEERRRDHVKLLGVKLEGGRVMLRNLRQELRERIEKQKNEPGVSEDDIKAEQETLDKMTREYDEKLQELADRKEEEIMAI